MKCGIYKITSPSGRVYIGQSVNIKSRWTQYKYFYRHDDALLLYRSLKKHGYENHLFTIIEECDRSLLDEREIFWIANFKCNNKRYRFSKGLNMTDGGNKPPTREPGYKMSDNAKIAISKKAKENHKSGIYTACQSTRTKMKVRRIGIDTRAEQRRNKILVTKVLLTKAERSAIVSKVLKTYHEDHIVTDETKNKMSQAHTVRFTPELRKHYSKLFKGRKALWKSGKQSDEYVKKRTDAIKKPIVQLTLDGVFVKHWDSVKQIKTELHTSSEYVSQVCKKTKESHHNFKWMYKNEYLDLQKQED